MAEREPCSWSWIQLDARADYTDDCHFLFFAFKIDLLIFWLSFQFFKTLMFRHSPWLAFATWDSVCLYFRGMNSLLCFTTMSSYKVGRWFYLEICLLTNARRTATIEAKSVCDIYILHAEDFREVVDEYPEMRQVMESVATKRLSRMGKSVDFSACPSRECLLAKLQSSHNSSVCGSCSNLLHPPESNPEIVITRDVTLAADPISNNFIT